MLSLTTEKTAVALRVLAAINDKHRPAGPDVALLRTYYPDRQELDLDEMACIVIQQALEQNKRAREARKQGGKSQTA